MQLGILSWPGSSDEDYGEMCPWATPEMKDQMDRFPDLLKSLVMFRIGGWGNEELSESMSTTRIGCSQEQVRP